MIGDIVLFMRALVLAAHVHLQEVEVGVLEAEIFEGVGRKLDGPAAFWLVSAFGPVIQAFQLPLVASAPGL